ncbi:hypothetical protein F5Y04DRAFT_2721 [Hypomontagnella monticulosa]|nr:hypothetical protein F5Y04DRAFT_2721 [Hypomontagnella monticulosa]
MAWLIPFRLIVISHLSCAKRLFTTTDTNTDITETETENRKHHQITYKLLFSIKAFAFQHIKRVPRHIRLGHLNSALTHDRFWRSEGVGNGAESKSLQGQARVGEKGFKG